MPKISVENLLKYKGYKCSSGYYSYISIIFKYECHSDIKVLLGSQKISHIENTACQSNKSI